ncbi:MAG: hypothetical protein RIS45_573 [Planctomycetota bacterium]|jgi:hypothetical protein
MKKQNPRRCGLDVEIVFRRGSAWGAKARVRHTRTSARITRRSREERG